MVMIDTLPYFSFGPASVFSQRANNWVTEFQHRTEATVTLDSVS